MKARDVKSKKRHLEKIDLVSEAHFTSSRSSGPGGQNVNKVNTRVELRFNIYASKLLNEREKAIIRSVLKSKLSGDGDLIISSQTERSQLKNKEKTIEKFYFMLSKALTPPKRRIPTKATTGSKLKRLEHKRLHSLKKAMRKPDY
jgi:ribosome-associated protein